MAFGDVIHGDDGIDRIVVWDGRRGSFELSAFADQEPSVFYTRSGHERKAAGSERKPHVRRVGRSSES